MQLISFGDKNTILIDKLKESAIDFRTKFDNEEPIEKLKRHLIKFNDIWDELEPIMNSKSINVPDLARHIKFLKYYLDKNHQKTVLVTFINYAKLILTILNPYILNKKNHNLLTLN